MNRIWKTRGGKVLEIAWMDSIHLIHAFNMQLRQIVGMGLTAPQALELAAAKSSIYPEVVARGLLRIEPSEKQCSLPRNKKRETLVEMCMLRAILDTNDARALTLWNSDREFAFQSITKQNRAREWEPIYLLFAKYRLRKA